LATYKNPFGFSLQVVESGENITLSSNGVPIASLQLPLADADGGVSTGNVAPLDLSFQNVPLRSLNDDTFQQLLQAVTDTNEADFRLSGTANVVAKTTIGNIPISGIPFDVPSGLKGK
jgi:antitoxin (DNA-binding transcriptional repressor) of toxin-antitoxin stability system